MDTNSSVFQLFDQTQPKEHLFIDVPCGQLRFALDFNILIQYSGVAKSIHSETKRLSKEKQLQTISNNFNQKFQEACESLKTSQLNAQFFLCILTGKRQTLYNSDLFDFFNLSKYFEIPKLLEHIQNFCEALNTTNEIFSVLANRKILEEEEKNFNEFIDCGHMKQKLSNNIRKLLQIKNFRNFFPLSSIFRIFQCSEKVHMYLDESNSSQNIELLKKENESLKQKIAEIELKKDNLIQKLKDENEKLKKIIDESSEKKNLSNSTSSFSSSSSNKKSAQAKKPLNSKIKKTSKIETDNIKSKNSQNQKKDTDKSQENVDTDIDIDLEFEDSIENKSEIDKSTSKNDNKSDDENKSNSDMNKSDNDESKSEIDSVSNKSESDKNKSESGDDKSDSDKDKNKSDSDDDNKSNKSTSSDDNKNKSESDDDNKSNKSTSDDNKSDNGSENDFDNFDDDFVDVE